MTEPGEYLENSSAREDWMDKSMREIKLIWFGMLSVPEAALGIVEKSDKRTIAALAWDLGLGMVSGSLTRGGNRRKYAYIPPFFSLSRNALGISLAQELKRNGRNIARSLSDNWQSDEHWSDNLSVIEQSFQRLAYDTMMVATGGLVGQTMTNVVLPKFKTGGQKDTSVISTTSAGGQDNAVGSTANAAEQ